MVHGSWLKGAWPGTRGRRRGGRIEYIYIERERYVKKTPSENPGDYWVDAQVTLSPPAIKKTIDLRCKTINLPSETIDSRSERYGLLSTTHKLPCETIDLANETIDLLSVFIASVFAC